MKLLINLSTLKMGGGQNVAMNFLYGLNKIENITMELEFLVAKDSAPHRYLESNSNYTFYVSPRNPIKRLFFEIFIFRNKIKLKNIDAVYTYFGYGLFDKKIIQISGSADSNLYYPEINFWSHYNGLARLKKWLVDSYRIWGLKRSTAVIYENEALKLKGQKLFYLKNTKFIKPSVNFMMESDGYSLPFKKRVGMSVGLFLCGWQLNKNIMIIPDIAKEFKRRGTDFKFIITAPMDGSEIQIKFCEKLDEFGVNEMVSIVGVIHKRQLKSIYSQIDFVFLLSLLESFSNNIIESWYFSKPLIIANEEWAHSICKDAALYVDRDSEVDIVDKTIPLIENKDLKNIFLDAGKAELSEYPTIEERIDEEFTYIEYITKNI